MYGIRRFKTHDRTVDGFSRKNSLASGMVKSSVFSYSGFIFHFASQNMLYKSLVCIIIELSSRSERRKELSVMRVANRQAVPSWDRDQQFEALAAYANMGDRPEHWRKFRLKYPRFFPTERHKTSFAQFSNLSDWLYDSAEDWKQTNLFPQLTITPLLWYRDILRAVWAGNDQSGAGLSVLYGFEKKTNPADIPVKLPLIRPMFIPGESSDPSEQPTGGLPQGEPSINGVTGEIIWKFGCEFQQSVFELMHVRWRARICRQCGQYFVADKTAQAFCSTKCSGDAKGKRSLDYWNREGSKRRKANQKKGKAE